MALLKNILFLDIETAAAKPTYEDINPRLQTHWDRKSSFFKIENTPSNLYNEKAAIFAEYGKVICIGVGGFYQDSNKELAFKSTCLSQTNEKELLQAFIDVLLNHKAKTDLVLCAHNGKEFDYPYLCRRILINELPLPYILQIAGKKPWEVNHIDTLELWKFGDYKHYTSLDLLATLFEIPSSKSEISGADVNRVYHEENNLKKIAEYCQRDVNVLAQVYLKMVGNKAEVRF